MNATITWNDDTEADSNGDDKIVGSESACGRWAIEGRYIEGDMPSYFVLHDAAPDAKRKEFTLDSVPQCKRKALEILNAPPPPPPLSIEQQIQQAVNCYHLLSSNPKWKARDRAKAQEKWGVDIAALEPTQEAREAIAKAKADMDAAFALKRSMDAKLAAAGFKK